MNSVERAAKTSVIPTKEGSLAALGMTGAVIQTKDGSLADLGMTAPSGPNILKISLSNTLSFGVLGS